jgi:hypothetical protein
VLAFPIAGFIWSIAYLFLMGRVLERADLAMVGAIVTFPFYGLACGLVWMAAVAFVERDGARLSAIRALALALGLSLIAGLFVAGPRGFTLAPGAELFNFFLLLIVCTGALVAWRVDRGPPMEEPAAS